MIMANIDKSKCISCGMCFGTYTTVFKQWDDGKAEVINKGELTNEEKEIYKEAQPMCPVGAIE